MHLASFCMMTHEDNVTPEDNGRCTVVQGSQPQALSNDQCMKGKYIYGERERVQPGVVWQMRMLLKKLSPSLKSYSELTL